MAINPEDIKTKNDLVKFVESLAKEASTASKDWENEDFEWMTLDELDLSENPYDLLLLTNGKYELLASADLPAGTISQIRLIDTKRLIRKIEDLNKKIDI